MQKSILLLFLLISCSKSQDISFEDNLNGKWILNKVTCYCFFGEEYDFSKNSILVLNSAKDIFSSAIEFNKLSLSFLLVSSFSSNIATLSLKSSL